MVRFAYINISDEWCFKSLGGGELTLGFFFKWFKLVKNSWVWFLNRFFQIIFFKALVDVKEKVWRFFGVNWENKVFSGKNRGKGGVCVSSFFLT
jgi:hypothetical protein